MGSIWSFFSLRQGKLPWDWKRVRVYKGVGVLWKAEGLLGMGVGVRLLRTSVDVDPARTWT